MGEILPSHFGKCCCRFDLIIGCAVYVTGEIYMWAIMALTAIYSESKMIAANNDAGAFRNFTLNSSYYVTAFGNPSDGIGRAIILTQIAINGVMSVGFVFYCIFAVILLIGISEKNLGYFAPYLYLDTIFLYLSVAFIVVAILIQHSVMFRNSIIFALKFYPSSCIYSLYKKIGGLPITLSSYKTLHIRQKKPANPTIRLACSDTEFEESSRKSRVSFQEELTKPASEPSLSPTNTKHLQEPASLKPCSRKTLQLPLPVNNSYP